LVDAWFVPITAIESRPAGRRRYGVWTSFITAGTPRQGVRKTQSCSSLWGFPYAPSARCGRHPRFPASAANSAVMPEACFQHDRPRGAQFCAGHPLGHAPFLPDARKPRVSARI